MTMRELEKVLYCEVYAVTDPGKTDLEVGQLLTEEEFYELRTNMARPHLPRSWVVKRFATFYAT